MKQKLKFQEPKNRQMLKDPVLIPRAYISQSYNVIVRPMMAISVQN